MPAEAGALKPEARSDLRDEALSLVRVGWFSDGSVPRLWTAQPTVGTKPIMLDSWPMQRGSST
jgi:hypothetical protein